MELSQQEMDKINTEIETIVDNLLKADLPFYQGYSEQEKIGIYRQMLFDLYLLATNDGCIAAGLAVEVIKALSGRVEEEKIIEECKKDLGQDIAVANKPREDKYQMHPQQKALYKSNPVTYHPLGGFTFPFA